MMQGFIFELKIATYAELFIEEMSQSFMEINCKRSETIEMSECVRIANWFVQTFNFTSFAKKVTIEVCFHLLAVCLSQLISIPKGFTT